MDTAEKHMVGLLIIVLVLFFLLLGGTIGYMTVIPRCQEDVVLVGTGRFESGRWSSYVCGPAADDFIE